MTSSTAAAGPSASAESNDAVAALGVPTVRIDILRALRRSPATVSDIAAEVGYTRYGVRAHLDVLEHIGAIYHETVRVPGSFRPARLYRIDNCRLEAIAWTVFDAIADSRYGVSP